MKKYKSTPIGKAPACERRSVVCGCTLGKERERERERKKENSVPPYSF